MQISQKSYTLFDIHFPIENSKSFFLNDISYFIWRNAKKKISEGLIFRKQKMSIFRTFVCSQQWPYVFEDPPPQKKFKKIKVRS